jgi:hypothetical protein
VEHVQSVSWRTDRSAAEAYRRLQAKRRWAPAEHHQTERVDRTRRGMRAEHGVGYNWSAPLGASTTRCQALTERAVEHEWDAPLGEPPTDRAIGRERSAPLEHEVEHADGQMRSASWRADEARGQSTPKGTSGARRYAPLSERGSAS